MSFAFNTTSGVPANNINFSTNSSTDTSNGIATIGTLVLEWTRLSDLTGDPKYATLAQKGESYLLNPKPASSEPFPGLIGSNVNIANGQFLDASGGWSGGTDSFYEYLIKMYVYDPTRFSTYKDRWILAAQSTMTYLQSHPTTRPDITFVAEYNGQSLSLNEGHLTCFIGGNFILGGQTLGVEDFTQFGLNLTSGCHDTYNATVTKIGPERFSWNPSNVPATQLLFFQQNGFYVTGSDYILRPEVIESYYHAYVNTKDEKYREWAWTAFQGINKYCRTDTGYSSITNVNAVGGGSKSDVQESFWFAEVLKYLYLIFDDSKEGGFVQGTQGWVFNTEAHPFKVAAK
jgi:mannosyl-oligosaccharide alpha-1,2-mannosidase